MPKTLHVAVLEPYYGGSHAAFADVLRACSRHEITLVTMRARKWKWRMRGASIWFARQAGQWWRGPTGNPPDVILCSDMLSVADLRALLPHALRNLPIVCYFHENQLTYPIPNEQDRDYQYGMTNITSCLAADAVWFNSHYHLEEFLRAAGDLLRRMPDYVPAQALSEIRGKSAVLPPPVGVDRVDRSVGGGDRTATILWCHRWEYDKNPEPFFNALLRLDAEGCGFNLVLVGEQFRTAPPVFAQSWDRLESHIIHTGYIPDRSEYQSLLARCDLVVSTAIQENFGIAVVEAILAGCQPLLPDRLAYPELIPQDLHGVCLYARDTDLHERLTDLLAGRKRLSPSALAQLQVSIEARFGATAAVGRLDLALDRAAQNPAPGSQAYHPP